MLIPGFVKGNHEIYVRPIKFLKITSKFSFLQTYKLNENEHFFHMSVNQVIVIVRPHFPINTALEHIKSVEKVNK